MPIYITKVKAFPGFPVSDYRSTQALFLPTCPCCSEGHVDRSSWLDNLACVPVLNTAAGVVRVALATIHSLAHLFAALRSSIIGRDRFTIIGHLRHAEKGGAEILVGLIEAIPIVGFIYAWIASCNKFFFLVKIKESSNGEIIRSRYESIDYISREKLQEIKNKKDFTDKDLEVLKSIIYNSPETRLVKEAIEEIIRISNSHLDEAEIQSKVLARLWGIIIRFLFNGFEFPDEEIKVLKQIENISNHFSTNTEIQKQVLYILKETYRLATKHETPGQLRYESSRQLSQIASDSNRDESIKEMASVILYNPYSKNETLSIAAKEASFGNFDYL